MPAREFQWVVQSRRFLVGCSGSLAEKTALVDVDVVGSPVLDSGAEGRIRAAALALCPEDPLFRIAETDWPTGFLVDPQQCADTASARLGQWVVALTVAIQRWGRDPVWRGRVLRAEPTRIQLAIPWRRQRFFNEALELALALLHEQLSDSPSDPLRLAERLGDRWTAILNAGLAPNTGRFIEAGAARDIPFDLQPSFVQLGWGAHAERFDMSFTGRTSWMASAMAANKWKSKTAMVGQLLPTPQGRLVDNIDQAVNAANLIGWPVVIKPSNRELGVGVVVGIPDADALRREYPNTAKHSTGSVIVEECVPGDDHRLLVVNDQFLAAARRKPAAVTGDGVHTVAELVALLNRDSRRGTDRNSLLQRVVLDDEAHRWLALQGLTVQSVVEPGRTVNLSRVANISCGGTAEEVTHLVHPDNRALAERAARTVGLDIVGVDFITTDISRSWREVGGAICELNGQPGFRPHWLADPDRDINGEILDILFAGKSARIPTAAITGTNGKTTTSEMLYRIWTAAGKVTGVCTTHTLRIGTEILSTENLSGQPGGRVILNDPAVEAAVLEMPRKGLIIFGHPCDRYDVAALLNVQNDHLGADGIATLEEMAELKAQVLERARHAIVVNADDPLCMAMRARAGTDRHILVTADAADAGVITHRGLGGEAVFVAHRDGAPWIIMAAGDDEHPVLPVHEIPATMNGLLHFNISNAMFAVALAWAQGIDPAIIRRALAGFVNSPAQNPGRYNVIGGLPFQLLLDFAHNPDGVRGICEVAAELPVTGRRILCSRGLGSRSAAQFAEVAAHLVATFDAFVLGCIPSYAAECPDYDGPDPVAAMLAQTRQHLLDHGAPAQSIITETDPAQAIRTTLALARPGDMVILLAEHSTTTPIIEEFRRSLAERANPGQ